MIRLRLAPRIRTAALLGAATLAGACKTEPKPTPPTIVPAPAPPNAVTFHAHDFAYSGPDTIPAGLTTITLVNDGPNYHHLQLVKIDSGHSEAEVRRALKDRNAYPEWTSLAGGPNIAMTGDSAVATFDLAPGWYAMICLVDWPDHVPYYAKGMVRKLYVAPPPAGAPARVAGAADVTITANDSAYTLSGPVMAGRRSFDVKVEGSSPHEVLLFKRTPGHSQKELVSWLSSYKGKGPMTIHGGVSAMEPGTTARFTANITPGDYLIACLVADEKGGGAHFMHGGVLAFTVQ